MISSTLIRHLLWNAGIPVSLLLHSGIPNWARYVYHRVKMKTVWYIFVFRTSLPWDAWCGVALPKATVPWPIRHSKLGVRYPSCVFVLESIVCCSRHRCVAWWIGLSIQQKTVLRHRLALTLTRLSFSSIPFYSTKHTIEFSVNKIPNRSGDHLPHSLTLAIPETVLNLLTYRQL